MRHRCKSPRDRRRGCRGAPTPGRGCGAPAPAAGHQAGGAFQGVAKGGGMGKAGIAGNALRQPHAMGDRQRFKQFFNPLVDIKQTQLQVEHRFPRHAEQKVARLNDARVDGANRHLEHPLAFDPAELVARPGEGRQGRARREVFAQRPNFRPVVVQRAAVLGWDGRSI